MSDTLQDMIDSVHVTPPSTMAREKPAAEKRRQEVAVLPAADSRSEASVPSPFPEKRKPSACRDKGIRCLCYIEPKDQKKKITVLITKKEMEKLASVAHAQGYSLSGLVSKILSGFAARL